MKLTHKLTTVIVLFTGLLALPHASSAATEPQVKPMSSITLDASITTKNQPVTLGYYGEQTQKAVSAFQKHHNLPETGKADPKTIKKLGLEQDLYTTSLKTGGKGLKVIFLQEKLVKLGLLKGLFYSGIVKHPASQNDNADHSIALKSSQDGVTMNSTNSPSSKEADSKHSSDSSSSKGVVSNNSSSKKDLVTKAQPKKQAKTTTQIQVKATAYTKSCPGCSGVTKTGIDLNQHPDKKVIAVDPDIIPLGSKVYVPGYGYAVAGDTGGAINGNHIDVYVQSKQAADKWGVKHLTITVVN